MQSLQYLLAIAVTLRLPTAAADDDFAKETVRSTELAPSLYMLEGAGGNMTALIGDDGVFLVDDDFEPMAGKLVGKLKELKGDRPRFIVNTHFHYDHTGGNKVFGPTATIIAATAARQRLMSEQTLWGRRHPAVKKQAWPQLTFDQTLSLFINDEEVKVLHLSHGHTDGDTVVFFTKGKVVSMGDLYFAGMYPIFHPEHGGDLTGYLQNIRQVLNLIPADCKVVPGHGPLSNKTDLGTYVHMIEASIDTVRKGIEAGESLEQIQKFSLAPKWSSFSHGYLTTDRWIALIYRSLKK